MALRANADVTTPPPYVTGLVTINQAPTKGVERISGLLLSLFQSEETPSAILQKFMVTSQGTATKVDDTVLEGLQSSAPIDESLKVCLASKSLEDITNETVLALPGEMWIAVFSFLDDLSASRMTCREWNSIILEHPQTCAKLFQKAFGCKSNPTKGSISTQFSHVQFNFEQQSYSESSPIEFNPLFSDKTISLLSGNLLLVCHSADQIVRQMWDISENVPKNLKSIALPKSLETLTSLTILLNTSYLVSSNEIISIIAKPKCRCVILDLTANTMRDLFEISHQNSPPTCLDYKQHAKARFAAIGFEDGKCEIWNLETLEVRDFQFNASISSICLDLQRGRLVVGFNHGLVEVWDNKTKPDAEKKCLGSYEMFDSPVKHLCIQGNIIAAGSKAEQAQEDEIKLMPMHFRKNANSIFLPEIAWITFQGTQLVVIHGTPLQIRRLDFSVSNQEFFKNLNLNSTLLDDEGKFELYKDRFNKLTVEAQKEILSIYNRRIKHNHLEGQTESQGDDENPNEFVNAIHEYYYTSPQLST